MEFVSNLFYITSYAHCNDTLWVVIDNNNSSCVFQCRIFNLLFKLACSTKQNRNFSLIISFEIGFSASIHNFAIRLRKYYGLLKIVFCTHVIFLIGIAFGTSNNFDFSDNFMKLGISGIQTLSSFFLQVKTQGLFLRK